MKKKILIFLILTFMVMVTPVFGGDKKYCADISELAEMIMKKRQANVPVRTLMAATENKIAHDMILEAYNYPLMNLDENKREAIVTFGNKKYLECVKKIQK